MLNRFPSLLLALVLTGTLATPAAARSAGAAKTAPKVVASKTSKKRNPTIYLAYRLMTGHAYQVRITSSPRESFSGQGFENFNYVQNARLVPGNKPLQLQGKTPYTMKVTQPVNTKLSEWDLAVQVQTLGARSLTVRLVDLGKQ